MNTARRWLAAAGVLLLPLASSAFAAKPAGGGRSAPSTVHDFEVHTIDGATRSLAEYRGKTLLIVNTASRCGFTPQYEALEALYRTYAPRGFVVLGFPANNFLGQEPGTDAEIRTFCSTKYHVTFPMFAKVSVRGRGIAPLFAWLTQQPGFSGAIPWNFTKFLVGPDGRVAARFDPAVSPGDARVTQAIERMLAKP